MGIILSGVRTTSAPGECKWLAMVRMASTLSGAADVIRLLRGGARPFGMRVASFGPAPLTRRNNGTRCERTDFVGQGAEEGKAAVDARRSRWADGEDHRADGLYRLPGRRL